MTEPLNTIRVLLVDDQSLIRAGFAMVIDSQPDMSVVAQAGTGHEAITETQQQRPDVILMDIRMPVLDGIAATERILTDGDAGCLHPPKIIVLTTFDTDEYALQALRAGASGFLLKDTEPEVLLESIRNVVTGGAVVAPTTTRRLLNSTILSAPEMVPDARQQELLDSLTRREKEILQEMATGASNTEIASHLFVSESTVKTHVRHILIKLDARDCVQAVVFAYDSGLVAPQSSS